MAEWWEAAPKASTIDIASDAEGASPQVADIARSVYHQESGSGKNTKTSNAGAVGGMQILPGTFKEVADPDWDINNPEHNARAGVRYLKKLSDMADGDPKLTAVGYYGGPGAIEKAKKGIAVSDPRNPNAPNTLQYGEQVASRVGGGDKWWADAPIDGADAAPPQATKPEAPVAASAPQVATGSVTKQGAKPAPQGPQEAPDAPAKAPGTPEAPADTGGTLTRGLRGVAQGLGAGWYDELMGGMNYLEGKAKGTDKGRSWDDYIKVERDKLANGGTAGTVGNVAGAVGSVLIPGAAVTKAPLVVSKLGRLGLGVAQGAAQGAVLGAGEADDGDRLAGAGKGAAIGGALGTIAPILTGPSMAQKVQRFVNKAGGEEQARRVAEASTSLKALADREAQGGVALGARDANAVANRGVQEALDVVKDPAQRAALLRGRGLNDTDLSKLPPEIAETIRFQNTVQAATAAKPASNNLISRAGRVAADNLIPIKPVRDYVVNHVLGGRATREQTIAGLVGQSKVADAVTAKLGASRASQALETLKATAKAGADKDAAAAAQKIADAAAKAQQQAKVKITMAKATRMPQGGGFQTLLAGGDSGLNLPSKQAIQDLRTLSNHPVLGKLADELRRTGAIKDNEAGFYGLTNALRKLQEGRQAAWRAKNPKGNP